MTNSEKNLAAYLLECAADEFSNHGCNDFDLTDFLESEEDIRKFVREFYEFNKSPEDYNPADSIERVASQVPDWAIMAFLAEKIKTT